MMCAALLRSKDRQKHGRLYRANERIFNGIVAFYGWTLTRVLRHPLITLGVLVATVGLNFYLYATTPTELFPQQDTGRLTGQILADQDTSSQAMRRLLNEFAQATSDDPAVEDVVGFSGGSGGTANRASMFVSLKPPEQRNAGVDQVMARLRGKLSRIPGASLIFQPVQDLRVGGRAGRGLYQYTLQGDDFKELADWAPRVLAELQKLPGLVDVNSDQQNRGLEADLT
jgi:multidrug efflux pump